MIQSYFEEWSHTNPDKDTQKSVERFLASLSAEYEQAEELNLAHILTLAENHWNDVLLEKLQEDIRVRLARGDTESALTIASSFCKLDLNTPAYVDVLRDEQAQKKALDNKANVLIRYPGPAGEFFGNELAENSLIGFMGPIKSLKCLSEDSRVLLADGQIATVAEIVESGLQQSVVTLNERTKQFESMTTVKFWNNGVQECWKVTTKTGREVCVTTNHKFLTPDGWKELRDLAEGEFICVPRKLDFFGTQEMDESVVKFLAYMLAEGSCTQNRLSFTNTDPQLVGDFRRVCGRLDIECLQRGIQIGLSKTRQIKDRFPGVLSHVSSKTKLVPSEIMTCPKEQIALFLRIFFSCDGTVNKKNHVMMTLANELMLRQISHLLLRFGIVHSFRFHQAGYNGKYFDAWKITISAKEYVNLFFKEINMLSYKRRELQDCQCSRSFLDKLPWQIAGKLYKDIEEEMESIPNPKARPGKGGYIRKGHTFRQAMGGKKAADAVRQAIRKKKSVTRLVFSGIPSSCKAMQEFLESEILWDEIVSIESVGQKQTYDLAVPKHHNFVADDCVVHNSYICLDIAWRALLQGRRVAYFQIGDLSQDQIMRRFWRRAARRPLDARTIYWPVGIVLPPAYKEPAMVTREPRPYREPIVWDTAKDSFTKVLEKTKGDLRLFRYPVMTISVNDIKAVLHSHELAGWKSQVTIIDYAENLKPVNSKLPLHESTAHTWAMMRQLSEVNNSCVIAPHQSSREGYKTYILTRNHFRNSLMVLAHCTAFLGINMTDEERELEIMRLNFVVRREEKYSERLCLACATCIDLANPCVVSALPRRER